MRICWARPLHWVEPGRSPPLPAYLVLQGENLLGAAPPLSRAWTFTPSPSLPCFAGWGSAGRGPSMWCGHWVEPGRSPPLPAYLVLQGENLLGAAPPLSRAWTFTPSPSLPCFAGWESAGRGPSTEQSLDVHPLSQLTLFCRVRICWARPLHVLWALSRAWTFTPSPSSFCRIWNTQTTSTQSRLF